MKTLIAATLVALTAALPATAQVGAGAAGAIAHFNSDYDSQDQRVTLTGDTGGTVVSTRSGSFDGVFARFNADHDSQDDVRGLNGATLYAGQPSVAGDIFDRIAAESAEGE